MKVLTAARKKFSGNSKLITAIVAGATFILFAPVANALTYTASGAATQLSLGDTLGTDYDKLQVIGLQGAIAPNTTIQLNKLIFTAGVNATTPANYNNMYSFTESITIGSNSGTLVVPFNLSINYSDTLTIAGGTALSILVGANLWNLVINGLTLGPNSGGSQVGYLTAQVTESAAATPLPAALVLFGSGLGAIGLFGRRRKQKSSAVIAA